MKQFFKELKEDMRKDFEADLLAQKQNEEAIKAVILYNQQAELLRGMKREIPEKYLSQKYAIINNYQKSVKEYLEDQFNELGYQGSLDEYKINEAAREIVISLQQRNRHLVISGIVAKSSSALCGAFSFLCAVILGLSIIRNKQNFACYDYEDEVYRKPTRYMIKNPEDYDCTISESEMALRDLSAPIGVALLLTFCTWQLGKYFSETYDAVKIANKLFSGPAEELARMDNEGVELQRLEFRKGLVEFLRTDEMVDKFKQEQEQNRLDAVADQTKRRNEIKKLEKLGECAGILLIQATSAEVHVKDGILAEGLRRRGGFQGVVIGD